MRTNDGYIIHKCLNGKPEVFGFLVDKYRESVFAFAYSELRNFHDAEDITQEVFIKAYRKLKTLRQYDSFHAWLYSITSHLCKDLIRSRQNRPDCEFIEDQPSEALIPSSMDSYREDMAIRTINEALDSLPQMYSQTLTLYYLGGMSIKEIAIFLGTSINAIKHRLSRARAQLKGEVLGMMSETFDQQRLKAGFTFRIVEAVKHIKIQPVSPIKSVPWILSLAAGVIFGVLSLGSGIKLPDLLPAPMSSPLPEKSGLIMTGEFPLYLMMTPEMSILSGKQGDGSGGESNRPTRQNAFSLAPKGEDYTFVRSWPEEILGLRNPCSAVIDSSGNVYVTDSSNHRIQKFDLNGNPLIKWGTYGSGDEEFHVPFGITMDGERNVYVVDWGNHRIKKFDSDGNFLTKWGSQGTGDGQFYYPRGIAIDSSGNIYVLESNRIQKFNSNGNFLMKWGTQGSGDGEFKTPFGIAIDGLGNVYIGDTYNHRIQKFDSEGKFLAKWGTEGSGDGQFEWPEGITIDGSGNVYVVDTSNNRIQKFDSNGNYLAKWGARGFGDGQFYNPGGIAFDDSGNVYVADTTNNRIQKFDSNGRFLTKFGTEASNDGQFGNLWAGGVAVDNSGSVYVCESCSHRIQKFDTNGKFLKKWGTLGSGDGQFRYPSGLAIDRSGNVYVVDQDNNRIQKFDSNGRFLAKFGTWGQGDGQFFFPWDVAIDQSGNVYVADSCNNRIQVFNSNGKFLMKWGTEGSGDGQFKYPYDLTVDSSGNIYVADSNNNRIQKFDSNGNFLMKWGSDGSSDGQFRYPTGMVVDSSGDIYVVDSNNNRIQKFDSEGKFLTKWGTYGAGDMEFGGPRDIAISNSGDIYVADSLNFRIKVFRPVGGGVVEPVNKQPVTWGQVKQTELYQNYPNPFNPETWIPYQLGEDTKVEIRIYTSDGQLVRSLNLGHKQAGSYTSKEKAVHWDGNNEAGEHVSSGIYFYTIQAGSYSDTKKMVITE